MAIQTEVWARDIAEAIFPMNDWITKSVSDDQWVDNKTVHLPQAGALPGVSVNRSSFPATATGRTDTDATYDLREHTSDPTVIRDIEEVETSYDKRQSVLRDHIEVLNKNIANWMQYDWAPTEAVNMVRTTGGDRVAVITGATGNRKKLKVADIITARGIMDDMDLPLEGRQLLIPAYMYNDLLLDNWEVLLDMQLNGQAKLNDGVLLKIMGFEISTRGKNNLLSYSNAGTPVRRAPDAANLASANTAALCWAPNYVRRAKGAVKVYSHLDDPTWYGSTFSALARAAGSPRYTNHTGVVAIVEAAGS